MNILSRILAPLARRVLSFDAWMTLLKPTSGIPTDFPSLVTQGYLANPIVSGAINLRGRMFQLLRWHVSTGPDGKQEIKPQHPLTALLNRPNALMSKALFFSILTQHLDLAGAAFIVPTTNAAGKIIELYLVPPHEMTVHGGKLIGEIKKYTHKSLDATDETTYEPKQVLYLWYPNPANAMQRSPPLQCASYSIKMGNAARAWNASLLANWKKPPGIYQYPAGALVSPADHGANERQLEDKYGGPEKAGKAMMLRAGMTWQPLGHTPAEMDWARSLTRSTQDIGAALGVPALLLQDDETGTYANKQAALRIFHNTTILPQAEWLAAEFTNFFRPFWKTDNLTVDFDHEHIAYLQGDPLEAMKAVASAHYLKIDEKRGILGHGEVEGGDRILVPSMLVPLDKIDEPRGLAPPRTAGDEPQSRDDGATEYTDAEVRHFRATEAVREPFDDTIARMVTRYLNAETELLLSELPNGPMATVVGRLHRIVDDDREGWIELIRGVYHIVAKPFALGEMQHLLPRVVRETEDEWVEHVDHWLRTKGLAVVDNIVETTKNGITATLSEGVAAGEGMDALRDRVQQAANDMTPIRARRIARTEVASASNIGGRAGALATHLNLEQSWFTAMDGRQRDIHGAVHRQTRRMDEPFDVGGEEMECPGDPSASAENRCNCRCSVTYREVSED